MSLSNRLPHKTRLSADRLTRKSTRPTNAQLLRVITWRLARRKGTLTMRIKVNWTALYCPCPTGLHLSEKKKTTTRTLAAIYAKFLPINNVEILRLNKKSHTYVLPRV
jgi:hypothetical protein